MIVVFLIDTSASMQQVTSTGLTLLDYAKSAVEHYMKVRSGRDHPLLNQNCKYLLFTTGDPEDDNVSPIKIGWDRCTNLRALMEELKNLTAMDGSDFGKSFHTAFEYINKYRLQTGMDHYTLGQCPWYLETTIFIVLTDGLPEVNPSTGDGSELYIPPLTYPGAELTKEPYRWDQRIFTLALKIPSIASANRAPKYPLGLKYLSEATGGHLTIATSARHISTSVNGFIEKSRKQGVVVNFQEMEGNHNSHKCMLVLNPKTSEYFWPLPEPYENDRRRTMIRPRDAQPTFVYQTGSETKDNLQKITTWVLDQLKFPSDTYTLEGNLNISIPPGHRWPIYMKDSSGESIGYLATSESNKSSIEMTILPHDFPVLFGYLYQIATKWSASGHISKSGNPWSFPNNFDAQTRSALRSYALHSPSCYLISLNKALKTYNLHQALDSLDIPRLTQVPSFLKRYQELTRNDTEYQAAAMKSKNQQDEQKDFNDEFNHSSGTSSTVPKHLLLKLATELRKKHHLQHQQPVSMHPPPSHFRSNSWPGNIARLTPAYRALQEDQHHHIPIAEMGSYQELLLRKEALRDPLGKPEQDEDTPTGLRRRQLQVHFGNPYRKSNYTKITDDAADDDEAADEAAILKNNGGRSGGPQQQRRRPRGGHKSRRKRRNKRIPSPGHQYLSSPPHQPQYMNKNEDQKPARELLQPNCIESDTEPEIMDQIAKNQSSWTTVENIIRADSRITDLDENLIVSTLDRMMIAGSNEGYVQQALALSLSYRRRLLFQRLVATFVKG